jgi:hypothetical protein
MDQPQPTDGPRRRRSLAWIVVAALLALFAILSTSASMTKGPTYDEPLHLVGGYVQRTAGDYRVDPANPALFGYWASLPLSRSAIPDTYTAHPRWAALLDHFMANQWDFTTSVLFRTEGVDGAALVQRARLMFIPLGVALGAVIAIWAWQLKGAVAAIIAAALLALDPNFLAHSAIIKNDVPLALLFTILAWAMWRFGERGSIRWALLMALCAAAAINVKYSGVLAGPIIAALLVVRASLPAPWRVAGMNLNTIPRRLAVGVVVCALVALVCYVSIWATYRFRFAPTADPQAMLNTHRYELMVQTALARRHLSSHESPTREQILAQSPGAMVRGLIFAEKHRLLPQAWIHGFVQTYAAALERTSFLMDELSNTGWWYYFPLAMLFKTPVGTWLALLGALAVGSYLIAERRHRQLETLWPTMCLFIPFGIYLLSAMTSNLNIGVRHVLPVYPFMYVAAATLLAEGVRRWRTPMIKTLAGIGVLLALETCLSWPNYIPFFNFAVGGPRGGIDLLGDSNLDWGQDLPLVKRWQDQHPDTPLAFGPMYTEPGAGSYFGTVPPEFYGIRADPLPPGVPSTDLAATHVLAVSATMLQDIYLDSYSGYRHYKPIAILGGTIYLYDLRPPTTRAAPP